MVVSQGTSPVTPRLVNAAGVAAAAHSAMATNERAPATTAHAAIAAIPGKCVPQAPPFPGIGYAVQCCQQRRRRPGHIEDLVPGELINDGVRGR
jgi:hypothetical protein